VRDAPRLFISAEEDVFTVTLLRVIVTREEPPVPAVDAVPLETVPGPSGTVTLAEPGVLGS